MGLHKGKYHGVLVSLCLTICHILVMFEGKNETYYNEYSQNKFS